MDWLPPPVELRARLKAAKALDDPDAKLAALARLATANLSYLETVQLDAALSDAAPSASSAFEPLKLAVLAASTVDHLLPAIRVAGLRRGFRIETCAAAYGQYRQELLDPGSGFHGSAPDAVLLSLTAQTLIAAAPLDMSAEAASAFVEAVVADLRGLWARARGARGALVIQQSLLDVSEPVFGGLDAAVPGAPSRLVARINAALAEAAHAENVLWLDVERAAARDGRELWFDMVRWLQGKMEISHQASMRYGDLVARLLAAARGRAKKCLVLDLDNTLWGGVIGDDGLQGIVLGEGSGVGEAHLALQKYAKTLKDRGVILAVCSKNSPEIAEAAFRDHPEMVLKRSDIAAFFANWTDKAENLAAIAKTLNIGLDSLVFVDDNPVERARIREALPMVGVPELPKDPAHYVRTLASAGYFEAVSFTREDRERGAQYVANAERDRMQSEAGGDMDAFLAGLGMSLEFGPIGPLTLARATQLINKTNQFNTNTIRRTEREVEALAAAPGALALQFRLVDKFGDNGVVSVLIAAPDGEGALDIANWVMSCRVFGRELEREVMNIVVAEARRLGVRTLTAAYIPTEKNGVVKDLFETLGFAPVGPQDAGGARRFALALADYEPRPTHIAHEGADA